MARPAWGGSTRPGRLTGRLCGYKHRDQAIASRESLGPGLHGQDPLGRGRLMKALTFHGNEDVRVDEVPDPSIEQPTDAIIRITSTAICGSDLHLYGCSGRSSTRATSSATSRWGSSRRSAPRSTHIKAGDRVVIPFNISCGHCWMCERKFFAQCETTQVTRPGKGRLAVRLHEDVRPGAGRPGRVPARAAGPVRADQGARRAGRTSASSSSPTCCRPPGRRSTTRRSPRGARSRSSGSARSAR